MNKEDAVKFQGCSPRRVERYFSAGKIGRVMVKGTTRLTPDYDEADLRRLKEEIDRPKYQPAVVPHDPGHEGADDGMPTGGDGATSVLSLLPGAGGALAILADVASKAATDAAVRAVAEIQAQITAQQGPVFWTVEEAAEQIGVSVGAVERAIRASVLTPRKRLGRGRRLKTEDVRHWAKNL